MLWQGDEMLPKGGIQAKCVRDEGYNKLSYKKGLKSTMNNFRNLEMKIYESDCQLIDQKLEE